MSHKCPSEPCEDCWEEARTVGFVLVIIGMAIAFMWLIGGK